MSDTDSEPYSSLREAASREMPVTKLPPEAHEDALIAEKDLWQEGMKKVGQRRYATVQEPSGTEWIVYSPQMARELSGMPSDVDLALAKYSRYFVAIDHDEGVEDTTIERYGLSPTEGVILITERMSRVVSGYKVRGAKPNGPAITKAEVGVDEIRDLTRRIESSRVVYIN